MAEPTRLPINVDKKTAAPAPARMWAPFDTLRREIDRVFDDVHRGWGWPLGRHLLGTEPMWPQMTTWDIAPAVDVAEKEKAYEITAELPGLEQTDIELKVANGMLMLKGEKKDEKEAKEKDYYVSERRYGAFQRSFMLPEGIDPEKIVATFKNGVLTIEVPKTVEVQMAQKKIEVKAA